MRRRGHPHTTAARALATQPTITRFAVTRAHGNWLTHIDVIRRTAAAAVAAAEKVVWPEPAWWDTDGMAASTFVHK